MNKEEIKAFMESLGYEMKVAKSTAEYFGISSKLRVYVNESSWALHFIATPGWTPYLCDIESEDHFKALVFNLTGKQL